MFNKLFDLPEKKKLCEDCLTDITGTHAKRKLCATCKARREREYREDYVDDNRDLINEKQKVRNRLRK